MFTWLHEPLDATDGLEQIQQREYLQSAYQHFNCSGALEEDREICIVGHGAYIAETRADVADACDGGCHPCYEVEPARDIDCREQYHYKKVAEYVAESIAHLFFGTHPAIYTDGPDTVRADGQGYFAADSLGCQDGTVNLYSSGCGT